MQLSQQDLLTIFVAAISGILTGLAIEVAKYIFDRRVAKEERENQRQDDLRSFLAPPGGENTNLCPVARLLVSTASVVKKVSSVDGNESREIRGVIEVKEPIVNFNAVTKANKPRKLLFFTLPPKTSFPVCRTYYRRLSGNPRSDMYAYAEVWTTRYRVVPLGAITTIGRNKQNDLVLDDSSVSRQHAVIRFENKQFVVHNLAITNSVEVNDCEVEFSRVLQDGDVIEIIPFLIEFQQRKLP